MASEPTDNALDQVRLSHRQRRALLEALDNSGLPQGAKVFVYGSRTQLDARGGDLDLLVQTSGVDSYELAGRIRRAYRRILDERIDVVVVDSANVDPDQAAFLRTVSTVAIR